MLGLLFIKNNLLLILLLFVFGCGGAIGNDEPLRQKEENSYSLISKDDMEYQGAFRVPNRKMDGSSKYSPLSYGGTAIYYNEVNDSLFMIGHIHEKMIIELSIPQPVNSHNIKELKTSEVVQPLYDIANSQWGNLGLSGEPVGNGGRPGGFLIYDGRLVGSSYAYYDGGHKAFLSHFLASPKWSTSGSQYQGMYQVGESPLGAGKANNGFVGGYMAHVPEDRQAEFGGPALTGQAALAIVGRTSFGPCVWVFDPSHIGVIDPVPATMLVGYPANHTTLGTYSDEPNLFYNRTTQITGVVFPEGSNSILFFGRHGLGITGEGDSCYGIGVSDPELHGTESVDHPGVTNCYDPSSSSKGTHAYPYVYRVWAYDANDLLKVKRGVINPDTEEPFKSWDIKPYAIWNLDFPFGKDDAQILGAAYDPEGQRIFISQYNGEKPAMSPLPLIHVYRLNIDD